MATIKAYTDPSQSKTLSKILPLESADGGWYETDNPLAANTEYWLYTKYTEKAALPAWSLAALLGVLPKSIIYTPNPTLDGYCCKNIMHDLETYGDNPVDACVAMIEKLNELNLL